MPISSLPLDIKEILTKYFDSVFQLELLFFFHEHQDKAWSVNELKDELRNSTTLIRKQLRHLSSQGFLKLAEEDRYQYLSSGPLALSVDRLFDIYHERPVAVIAYLYEKPSDSLKSFADAFKITKD